MFESDFRRNGIVLSLVVSVCLTGSSALSQPTRATQRAIENRVRIPNVFDPERAVLDSVRRDYGASLAVGPSERPSTRIINGDVVSTSEQLRLGLVTVNGGCSGTLLRNDWVLTAGHCLAAVSPRVASVLLNGVNRVADRIYEFGSTDGRGMDAALLHLSTPFPPPPGQVKYEVNVARVSGLDLRDQTAVVYGQGLSTMASGVFGATGGGTYRIGVMKITPESVFALPRQKVLLEAKPIFNFGACLFGDSGGPMFVTVSGFREVASIVQTGDMNCGGAAVCTAANTTEVRSCRGPKLYDHWEAFLDIMATPWDPADESALFDIGGSEWASTNQINGSVDTDVQPWAAAARSANLMCFNRGYAGGLMNGHQLNGRFGLSCASAAGAVWRDATSAEILATPWSFADVNTTSWAQANRSAARLCENGGSVGGHFNGNIVGAPGVGRLMGLICYRGGARRFNVTSAQLGTQVANPDLMPWAEAGRRTNNFCQLQGFRSGFLNGHFFPDGKMGIICH